MRNVKKIVIIIIVLFGLLWTISLLSGYVIVIPISKYHFKETLLQRGDTINPLKDLDFNKGSWKAYLVISQNDKKNLNGKTVKSNCVETSDIDLLNQMKRTWNFRYTEGDMATAESGIYLFNNGKLVFKSGIVFNKSGEGLQSEEYGWLETINKNELSRSCNKFRRTYWPIRFL